jgi:Flp pilus assembly protein TadG
MASMARTGRGRPRQKAEFIAMGFKFAAAIGFWKSRSGNVAIITALAAPVMIAFCGLGADTGYWYFRQRDLQGAADIAAYNGTVALQNSASSSAVQTASTAGASTNGWNSGQGAITVNTPPTSGPNQNSHSVEVLLTENEQRFFTSILSSSPVPINVRAVATFDNTQSACMVGLNRTAADTVKFWGNALADFTACNIVSNSNSSRAFSVGGAANVTAPCVDAVGGDYVTATLTLTSCSGVKTKSPAVMDPYAGVPSPAVGTCHTGPIGSVLDPATYCGGLTLNSTVTLNPGVYVISGGTLKINASADVSGTGVTFFLTNGATLDFNGNATLNISAPTSGPYSGLLFYGDRTQATAVNKINGNASSNLTGAIYFPSQEVDFLGNFSGSNGCTQVVADTIYYTGSATFSTNCSGKGMKTIPVPGSVTLVE